MALNTGGLQECLSSERKCAVPIPDLRVRKTWKEESLVTRVAPSEGLWEAWIPDGDTYVCPFNDCVQWRHVGKSGYLFKKTTQSMHILLFPQVSGKPRSSSASWQRPKVAHDRYCLFTALHSSPREGGNKMCNKHPCPMATPSFTLSYNQRGGR